MGLGRQGHLLLARAFPKTDDEHVPRRFGELYAMQDDRGAVQFCRARFQDLPELHTYRPSLPSLMYNATLDHVLC